MKVSVNAFTDTEIFWNIVLRDRWAGGYGFCKPAGVISSQGSEAPEGWNGSQGLAKTICLPITDNAIVLL